MTERRTVMVPLTEEWFRVATTARHSIDGTPTYVLTPPAQSARAGAWFRVFCWLVLIGAACVPWIIWVGGR